MPTRCCSSPIFMSNQIQLKPFFAVICSSRALFYSIVFNIIYLFYFISIFFCLFLFHFCENIFNLAALLLWNLLSPLLQLVPFSIAMHAATFCVCHFQFRLFQRIGSSLVHLPQCSVRFAYSCCSQ